MKAFQADPTNNGDIVKALQQARVSGEFDNVFYALTIPSYERGVARLLRYDRHP